jgi:hypothetical protein
MTDKNAHGGYMRIAAAADYERSEECSRQWALKNLPPEECLRLAQFAKDFEARRAGLVENFPHTVLCEGYYPEHDVATRWCWRTFGPRHSYAQDGAGWCLEAYSEYPACPIVLATKELTTGTNPDGTAWSEYTYKQDPLNHRHNGTWTTNWWGKTGYDYGFMEYCFRNEADRDAFRGVAETLGMGERYDEPDKPGSDPSCLPPEANDVATGQDHPQV